MYEGVCIYCGTSDQRYEGPAVQLFRVKRDYGGYDMGCAWNAKGRSNFGLRECWLVAIVVTGRLLTTGSEQVERGRPGRVVL